METRLISKTISQFRFGKPFNTGAVQGWGASADFAPAARLPFFEYSERDSEIILRHDLETDACVWGMGQNLGSLNRRGRRYSLLCRDQPAHTPDKLGLYGSHPFLVVEDSRGCLGVFVDYPGEIAIDCGHTDRNILQIGVQSGDLDLYLIQASTPQEVYADYIRLVGRPYFPPKWAFGFQQSRWGYQDEQSIRQVAQQFRQRGIPCDALYLDIDYLDRYKVFSIDRQRFPDLAELCADLTKQGFKVVPIVDPGIKIEEGYEAYESGLREDIFCKDADGKPLPVAVWPGLTYLPDFFMARARDWWAKRITKLMQLGFAGIWNDMNEPTVFYTPRGLEVYREKAKALFERTDLSEEETAYVFMPPIAVMGEDYMSWLRHATDEGLKVHAAVRSLYAVEMVKASAQGVWAAPSENRPFLLSRASYPGLHRQSAIWFGDNASWWDHLGVHVQMLQSLSMCGFQFCGADVGGFWGDATPDLLIRWTQLGAFSPFFRNHSAKGTRAQEPYAFDEETLSVVRDIIRLRYAFIPYLYSEYIGALNDVRPLITPLAWAYPSAITRTIEDQYMLGQSLMVAPVIQQNAQGRFVHLPGREPWLHWSAGSYEQRNFKVLAPGDSFVPSPIDRVPLFIKNDSLVVLTEPQNYIGEKPLKNLVVVGLISSGATYYYFDDDGLSPSAGAPREPLLELSVKAHNGNMRATARRLQTAGRSRGITRVSFELWKPNGECTRIDCSVD